MMRGWTLSLVAFTTVLALHHRESRVRPPEPSSFATGTLRPVLEEVSLLNLSSDQKRALAEIVDALEKETSPLWARLGALGANDAAGPSSAEALTLRKQIAWHTRAAKLAIAGLLTSKQAAKVREMHSYRDLRLQVTSSQRDPIHVH